MFNQTTKFILIGGLNTIIGFTIYFLCFKVFDLSYGLSLVISHIIGVINSFFWNRTWTFNVKKSDKNMILKFIVTYFITFLINYLLLILFIEVFRMNPLVAQVISTVLNTVVSFIGQKYWTFKVKTLESGK